MKKVLAFMMFFCFIGQGAFAQDITISWTHDNKDTVKGYNLYVKEYPIGEFVKIYTGAEGSFRFIATDGVKYGFCVSAFNDLSESLRSVELIYTAEGNVGEPIVIPTRPKIIIMQF